MPFPRRGMSRSVAHAGQGVWPMPFRYDPNHWRDRAEEMRRLAKDTKNHGVKQKMLRVAAEYEELASRAANTAPPDREETSA
jgi:hypothetical protein